MSGSDRVFGPAGSCGFFRAAPRYRAGLGLALDKDYPGGIHDMTLCPFQFVVLWSGTVSTGHDFACF